MVVCLCVATHPGCAYGSWDTPPPVTLNWIKQVWKMDGCLSYDVVTSTAADLCTFLVVVTELIGWTPAEYIPQ